MLVIRIFEGILIHLTLVCLGRQNEEPSGQEHLPAWQSAAGAASATGRQRDSYDPQGGGEEQLRQRKFPEIPPPWGAVVPAMQHAARQHKQAIAGVERPVKKIKDKCTTHLLTVDR